MKLLMVFVVVVALVLSIGHAASSATNTRGTDMYSRLPAQQREAFRLALERIIALERHGDWLGVYEFVDKEETSDGKSYLSPDEFARKARGTHLVDLVATGVYYIPPDERWIVVGCAKFSDLPPFARKHLSGIVVSFPARLTPDGWRFGAPPAMELDKDAGGVRGCTIAR